MTFGPISRRLALLAASSMALFVAACGGSDDDNGGGSSGGNTTLRAINLTTDLPSVDLYTGDTARFTGLATDAMSPNVTFEANTYSIGIRRAGGTSNLYSEAFTLSRDTNYTAVIAGRETGLVVRALPENYDTGSISAGKFRVRIFNLTGDAAGVDVFVTAPTTDLSGATPIRFTNASLTDFIEYTTADSLRLRVTSINKPAEVRLDVPLSGVVDKQYHTLVLTSSVGGTLINSTLIAQGGAATPLKSGKARVRVAAGVAGAGTVAATVGGTAIGGALQSPSVGVFYTEVAAGSRELAVSINGGAAITSTRDFVAGADYTLLASGTGGAPQLTLLTDDNRPPTVLTQAKLRLVNGVDGAQPMSLLLDLAPQIADVAAHTASGYAAVAAAGTGRAQVTAFNGSVLFEISNTPLLQPQGVYTVFMLGGQATPTGVARKDR